MARWLLHRIVVGVAAVLLVGCIVPPAETAAPRLEAGWPTNDWPTGSLEEAGFAPDLAERLNSIVAAEVPALDSLLIIRHGVIRHEQYWNGHDAESLHDIASVTKSWTSALVGMALAEGALPSLDVTLIELLPDRAEQVRAGGKEGVTLRHLLEMRSGIDFSEDLLNEGAYGGEELLEGDITELALGFPMAHPPGDTWNYSTLDSQLVSAVVQRATGLSMADYAAAGLFPALGVGPVDWWEDGVGTTVGGQNLSMRARDMARLGLLYLHGGMWEDEQLLPGAWVAESLTPQAEPAYYAPTDKQEVIEWYGLHWWIWKGDWFNGHRSFQASGFGGQQVLVFPELDLIIVTTANLAGVDSETSIEQQTALHELIRDTILPALGDAGG